MQNPFETIQLELKELKGLVTQLLTEPKEDLSQKKYTLKQAAALFNVDTQTISNYIKKGNIKAEQIGARTRILIPHHELYDSLNQIKSLKYKRQA
ncbi:DNA-binding protein [Flavobacterium aquidurense]|jgi:excisionase family DNA binding protein|uniref:helix-turn-helix domain-containing protein n=1 Tax=Flavobacterium aquidurense TaxID=362413 RepID=UPI000915BB1F|nr:helix-turn-helix domain-containing protein [Flavobacterium aquidurense]OXA71742.1 DNA-binding protein [Flavobacterium aquidurense]SHH21218.1 DNA binding domain-containing protein, excisionase family [Flavobacterium frigidimaris]